MDIICVPSGVISTAHPTQGILDLTATGFDNIVFDLAAFCSPWELEGLKKEPSELCHRAGALSEQYRKAGLRMLCARSPYLLSDTKRQDLNGLLLRLAYESIRACKEAGCKNIVVRPLFSGLTKGEEWEANREFYLKLAPAAREAHVMILLENQCRDVNGHLVRGICSDAQKAASWVDRLNEEVGEERFGFCMDVGTCSLCGQNMQSFVRVLDSRIKAVVLRENDGQREMSVLPFACAVPGGQSGTDWLGLIRGLREINYDGQLILNFTDMAVSFSPRLRRPLLKLARATAEYFRWQIRMELLLKKYKSIVLFGAGNMCRNYIKCYGGRYQPLFTCDNNQELWGTRFCGLEVSSPERLKELPKDCVILICNIYYREIEQQLRGMGIENRIEFFNDEYMPSFYFDRLERR